MQSLTAYFLFSLTVASQHETLFLLFCKKTYSILFVFFLHQQQQQVYFRLTVTYKLVPAISEGYWRWAQEKKRKKFYNK